MLAFPSSWRVYVAVEPVDMRKHFDGLWAEVEQRLGEDPRQGALFGMRPTGRLPACR